MEIRKPPYRFEMKKIAAFGDIHGCHLAASTAIRLSQELHVQAIFLGDYVDRGPSAMKTIQVLIDAKKKNPDWIFIRGNHDQMLLDLILEKATPLDIGSTSDGTFEYWQTVKSFNEWKNLELSQKKEVHDFLDQTIPYHENEDFIFCHAVLRDTGQRIDQKPLSELIWNYQHKPLWRGKQFIHGHLPVKEVYREGAGINLNTSCGYGGKLTGIVYQPSKPEIQNLLKIDENGNLIQD